MGMHVIGVKSTSESVPYVKKGLFAGRDDRSIQAKLDYIINLLPGTKERQKNNK